MVGGESESKGFYNCSTLFDTISKSHKLHTSPNKTNSTLFAIISLSSRALRRALLIWKSIIAYLARFGQNGDIN
jgi:hypothetical protein